MNNIILKQPTHTVCFDWKQINTVDEGFDQLIQVETAMQQIISYLQCRGYKVSPVITGENHQVITKCRVTVSSWEFPATVKFFIKNLNCCIYPYTWDYIKV